MANESYGLPSGDQKENMKKWLVVLSVVNGVLAVLMLVLVCRVLPREELDFDYLGFLVSVLGVLFTVVLGYNIYSIIDLRGLIDQNRQYAEEIEKQRKELRTSIVQLESELGAVYYQQIFPFNGTVKVRNSLYHLIKAVKIAAEDGAFSDCCYNINCIDGFNKEVFESLDLISKSDKLYLLDCVEGIPNKEKIENFSKLRNVVNSLKVEPDK